MKEDTIVFMADQVKVKTGRVDNSGVVEFIVGEYQLEHIKDLISLRDVNLKVTVEIEQ